MCSRERIILRAAKALARSPAARCIDPDAAMPWLPFTADAQRDAFIPPKPHPDAVLDEATCLWVWDGEGA